MLGQDEILADVQGLLQSRVGVFLQLRSQLQEMQRSPILTISDKATQLLIPQGQLETDLPTAIANAASGDVSSIISAGGFVFLMEGQISDVNDLRNEYIGLGESARPTLIAGLPDWTLWLIGGVLVLYMVKRKRK